MACGTPVVATAIPGTLEVVRSAVAGRLMEKRDPEAFVDAVKRLFETCPARERVRAYARDFSWAPTNKGQLELFYALSGEAR
jgi:glycosyltransferase involved in cell wall biosynthesis